MIDESKTKEQLINEMTGMRLKIAELEKSETERIQTEAALSQLVEKLRRSTGFIVDVAAMAVEARDPYIAGHQKRVADLARSIATEMKLFTEMIDGIRIAGLVHDLGKISIPSEILGNPRLLNPDEYNLVKTHAEIGYHILKEIDFFSPVALIVYQHHERMNGTGYPQGLKGTEILLESRILAVADVVEAICTHRPYRPELGIDKALKEILQYSGVLYDTEVVNVCIQLFREKRFSFKSR